MIGVVLVPVHAAELDRFAVDEKHALLKFGITDAYPMLNSAV